jgi:UDP-N-acetylmuramyl pentapeptide phosphotransferase/UDP-N-acetylglucosamine-1-phosphate transferase
MGLIESITLLIILAVCEVSYIKIARRLKIMSLPTIRSSHSVSTISGGGIVFYIALLICSIYNGFIFSHYGMAVIIGATVLAIVSFIDDLIDLPAAFRLLVHIAVVALMFGFLATPHTFNWYVLILICGVGFINAYNFMDGINGLMAGYTIVTLSTLQYCFYRVPGMEQYIDIVYALLIATVVFAFFNWRKVAICFSGDVGSIGVGFVILCLLYKVLEGTHDLSCVVFLIVYAVDAVLTILQRLFRGENILTSHRHHLYQVLANQWNIQHYKIAIYYSVVQLVINCGFFMVPLDFRWTYFVIITGLLITIYFILKRSPRSREERTSQKK